MKNFMIKKAIGVFEFLYGPSYLTIKFAGFMYLVSLIIKKKFWSVDFFTGFMVPMWLMSLFALIAFSLIFAFVFSIWDDVYLREWFN